MAVYAVYENQFKFGTAGRTSQTTDMKTVADLENFSPKFDNGVEEWNAMDQEGWISRFMTGKGLTLSFKGKRNVGDDGNDYIAGLALLNGIAVQSKMDWTFKDGTVVTVPCLINVTNAGGGDSTNVAPLEFDVMSDGKPTVTGPASE